jgi:hypothetical protein
MGVGLPAVLAAVSIICLMLLAMCLLCCPTGPRSKRRAHFEPQSGEASDGSDDGWGDDEELPLLSERDAGRGRRGMPVQQRPPNYAGKQFRSEWPQPHGGSWVDPPQGPQYVGPNPYGGRGSGPMYPR